ncbi:uncharacterized protein EI90DRAFT_1533291 [Cantharellus anzutake]|uniref:uncharacterized protein n=1 Tax=Cantharellus anzutake TaxID=1750568 RepID=UPI00190801B6|nr:uncharacterized protein EI90DRAFT_1533291 [Cantharellus anzutake]KAF8328544.1 hypothetical protein EI90DRAFT_1533291 [Cantharellus anzutake]
MDLHCPTPQRKGGPLTLLRGIRPRLGLAWFLPPTLDAPFPSLHTIEMGIPSQLAVMVLGCYPLSGVRFLRLLLTDAEDHSPTEQSLIQIVTICKDLRGLAILTPCFDLPVLNLPLPPDLTQLLIYTDGVESINNADLVDLCSKMPNLEDLGLIPVSPPINDDPPSLTLEVIRSIANVCPCLGRASLYINTDILDIQFSFDDPPLPSNHPLSVLGFLPSRVRDCSAVATYLCALFQDARRAPTIVTRAIHFDEYFNWEGRYFCDGFEDSEEEWGNVAEFMGTLRRRVIS